MNNEEDEFQRVEPLVKIEQRAKHNSHHREKTRNQHTEEKEQENMSRDWEFLQANPILPPGKYHIRQEPRIKLKHTTARQKFTRATFGGTSLNLGLKLPGNLKINRKVSKEQSKVEIEIEQQQQEQCQELRQILASKIQVYRRINNNELNNLGKQKDRALCSVFFDWKKQKIKSQHEPIIEHLANLFKIKRIKSESHWLTFDSRFESGNLFMSVSDPRQMLPTYQLHMQNDVNTKGCTQWYYFSVCNKARGKVRFRLMNFYKPTSLYQKGMKVLISHDRVEWRRTGTSIRYFRQNQTKGSYALEFIHEFDSPNKTTYFCYGYPYTYNVNLTGYIQYLFSQQKGKLMQKSNLCLSAMGNPIPMLTITNRAIKEQKPIIYIIGRQHPGQTPASFIIEGIINFLLNPSLQARELRDKFEFRVVPMVNVDGVISGNYRSNLSGSDVNRQWQFPSKKGQPEVYWLKQEIYSNRKNTIFFLDVHAHSRKMNSFFYGSKAVQRDRKLYPFVCSKLNKCISYNESSFSDDPSKKTTARVVLQNQVGVPLSLTFQCSFYGWIDAKGANCAFKQNDMIMIGESLGLGLYYSFIGIEKAKKIEEPKGKISSEKQKLLMKNSTKMLEKWNKQMQKEAAEDEEGQIFSEGSSLDPQHFQLKEEEIQFISQMTKIQTEKANLKDSNLRSLSTPKKEQKKNRGMLIYSTLSPPQINDSKLLTPRGEISNSGSLGFSMNQFNQISSARGRNKKKPFSVRQLELQLQYNGEVSPQRKLRGVKLKMQDPMNQFSRYESLDINRGNERLKNYKQDVLEMKRALKYLLETKSSDYEQYRSCFKSIKGDFLSTSDRRSYK